MNRAETNMNADHEKQLEAAVARELNSLGELAAPPVIAQRVIQRIARRALAPWYRREWQTWPLLLRAGSLAALLAAFAALCFESRQLVHFARHTPAAREVSGWFSLADAGWSAVNALGRALGLAIQSFSPAVIIGIAALLLFCYAAFLGLGTVYWRLAFARR